MSVDTVEPDIAALTRGLDAVDWVQLRLTARVSPGQRILSAMQARAFATASLRATFRRRFPDLAPAEIDAPYMILLP